TAQTNNSVNIFSPDLQTPYVRTWSFGLQRALGKDMAVEARYTGNHAYNTWTTENYNQLNIFENGFLDEFKLAQANLAANVGAGCGPSATPCSFAYKGPGTGTSPLPIYLAYITGTPTAQAGDPSKYTGTSWTNSTFLNELDPYKPAPGPIASNNSVSTN